MLLIMTRHKYMVRLSTSLSIDPLHRVMIEQPLQKNSIQIYATHICYSINTWNLLQRLRRNFTKLPGVLSVHAHDTPQPPWARLSTDLSINLFWRVTLKTLRSATKKSRECNFTRVIELVSILTSPLCSLHSSI